MIHDETNSIKEESEKSEDISSLFQNIIRQTESEIYKPQIAVKSENENLSQGTTNRIKKEEEPIIDQQIEVDELDLRKIKKKSLPSFKHRGSAFLGISSTISKHICAKSK